MKFCTLNRVALLVLVFVFTAQLCECSGPFHTIGNVLGSVQAYFKDRFPGDVTSVNTPPAASLTPSTSISMSNDALEDMLALLEQLSILQEEVSQLKATIRLNKVTISKLRRGNLSVTASSSKQIEELELSLQTQQTNAAAAIQEALASQKSKIETEIQAQIEEETLDKMREIEAAHAQELQEIRAQMQQLQQKLQRSKSLTLELKKELTEVKETAEDESTKKEEVIQALEHELKAASKGNASNNNNTSKTSNSSQSRGTVRLPRRPTGSAVRSSRHNK